MTQSNVASHTPSRPVVLHCSVAGRELQKWQPDDGADSNSFMMTDDGLGWDQFGVNKTKFGERRREQPLLPMTWLCPRLCRHNTEGTRRATEQQSLATIWRLGGCNSVEDCSQQTGCDAVDHFVTLHALHLPEPMCNSPSAADVHTSCDLVLVYPCWAHSVHMVLVPVSVC